MLFLIILIKFMILIARIGVAKRTHVLRQYDEKVKWGVGFCEVWAGTVSDVRQTHRIDATCKACMTHFNSSSTKLLDLDYK